MTIVVVQMTIPSDDIDLGRILCAGMDVRVTATQFVPTRGAVLPYFWVETDDPDAFEERVRDDEHVSALERLAEEYDRYLYRIEWARELDGLLSGLRRHDLVVEQATGTDEQWRFTVRGPNHENLSAFREALQDHGISSTVTSLRSIDAPTRDSLDLTDKQRQAVELALQRGYFSVPKETNLSELADRTGISRQAFSRRLNRGLANLLSEMTLEDQFGT